MHHYFRMKSIYFYLIIKMDKYCSRFVLCPAQLELYFHSCLPRRAPARMGHKRYFERGLAGGSEAPAYLRAHLVDLGSSRTTAPSTPAGPPLSVPLFLVQICGQHHGTGIVLFPED